MNLFNSTSLQMLEKGMAGAQLEQRAISQNIANVDTPNYKAKRAQFRHALDNASHRLEAERTMPQHIEFGKANGQAYVSVDKSTDYNHNGNNVDIDKEMSNLAKNQILYNALADRISSKYGSLKTAVKGGR
ncbi:flagellar basal body rod protein FlgB [Alteribacillus iranensis]|uniref:Flagellar basal body rod protein FlgB n=1 Tax=Alteribacillus iranensis TaxID=930128 RepID=A0A1I2A4U1_9BACI|nr:flagellar basal body rod protein FlgB [Alteribacillus iranensis]SFE39134.1 flagellar basal-body rod protein FlgB [Alteribacillus iranensis]